MRILKVVLSLGFCFLASCGGPKTPTPETLAGTWEGRKLMTVIDRTGDRREEDTLVVIELTKDGKFKQTYLRKGNEPLWIEGSYEVKNGAIAIGPQISGGNMGIGLADEAKLAVKSVTDDTLVIVDLQKEELTLKRKK